MLRHTFFAALFAAVLLSLAAVVRAQEPPAPPPPAPESSSKQTSAPAKTSHANDFLVRGTVFTPEGMAMPGVELRIRRSTEKKFKWDTVSNSRGEFAVRVKMGSDYEVTIHSKGFQPLTQTVDAKTGERSKELVFHMQRQEGKKS
jgi:hypothetical protein